MKVTSAYMTSAKNLPKMFEAIQKASVPPRFTHEFLEGLGFKSTYDRAFISVLRGLGFLDSTSNPTPAYSQYRDKELSKRVLAQQIRKAYAGLYLTDENAHNLASDAVKGKLATITGKDESVAKKMAATFKALTELADFTEGAPIPLAKQEEEKVDSPALEKASRQLLGGVAFSHVVYINLPATTDVAVYDAIFRSLREHIL